MKTSNWIMLLLAAALVAVSCRLAQVTNSPATGSADSITGATPNVAIENIMTRTSVRSYTDQTVADSLITTILRAGMAAPSAVNRQPWEFIVINSPEIKDSIGSQFRNAKMVANAQFAIVVCGDMDRLFEDDLPDRGYWIQDCSAATENMLLAAHSLGLGAVWCGIYPMDDRVEALGKLLNLPANLRPLNIVAFGYPESTGAPKDKWDPEKIHYNAF